MVFAHELYIQQQMRSKREKERRYPWQIFNDSREGSPVMPNIRKAAFQSKIRTTSHRYNALYIALAAIIMNLSDVLSVLYIAK